MSSVNQDRRDAPQDKWLLTKVNALRWLAAALFAFGMVTTLALLPVSKGWNQSVTEWVRDAPSSFHRPASALSLLSEPWLTIPVAAMVAVTLYPCRRHAATNAARLGVWLLIGTLIELALKMLLGSHASSGHLYRMGLPFGGFSIATGSRFPSGHTLRATLTARFALWRHPWLGGTFVVGMMVAVTYLYFHSMIEALGGLSLGWVLIEAERVMRKPQPQSPQCTP